MDSTPNKGVKVKHVRTSNETSKEVRKLSSRKLSGKIWVVDSTPNQSVKVKCDSLNLGCESRIMDARSSSYRGFRMKPGPRLRRVQGKTIGFKSGNVKQSLENRVTKLVEEQIIKDSEESGNISVILIFSAFSNSLGRGVISHSHRGGSRVNSGGGRVVTPGRGRDVTSDRCRGVTSDRAEMSPLAGAEVSRGKGVALGRGKGVTPDRDRGVMVTKTGVP